MTPWNPAELVIPLDSFYFRLAWYELHDQKEAADALRQLAAAARPIYRVDETQVKEIIDSIRGLDEKLLPLD
jgi:hypothetical protein